MLHDGEDAGMPEQCFTSNLSFPKNDAAAFTLTHTPVAQQIT